MDDDWEEKLRARFRQFEDDYLEFEDVAEKLSGRPDLHAFLILDKLFPSKRDMVCAAEHDVIYLEVGGEKLHELVDDDTIHDLVRCGVMYCDDGLQMFA